MSEKVKKVTADDVADAANALVADGVDPTVRGIRAITGGSNTTVMGFLNQWRESQKDRLALEEIEVPETIISEGDVFVARIWRAALEEATAGHDALRRELLASQDEVKRIHNEFADLMSEVETSRDELGNSLAAETETRAARDARIVELERDAAALVERVASRDAETAAAQLAVKSADDREASMRSERDQALSKIDAATAETAAVRADLSKELADVRSKMDKQTESIAQMQADLGTARSDLATARAEHAGTRDKLADVVKRTDAEAQRAEAKLSSLEAERDAVRAERDEVQRELAASRKAAEGVASKSATRADADQGGSPSQAS